MAPAFSLAAAVLTGGLLVVCAARAWRLPSRSAPARWWALSWLLAAVAAFLLPFFPGAVPAGLAQFSLVLGAWGSAVWARDTAGAAVPSLLAPTLLLGAAATWFAPGVYTVAWTGVPVVVSALVLGGRGALSPSPAVRAQALGLLRVLLLGPFLFALAWTLVPVFAGPDWLVAALPALVLGALGTLRSLNRNDPRLGPHQGAPFVVEKTQDAVLFLRADGAIQAANPALKPLLDWDEDAVRGRMLATLGADDAARHLLVSLEQLIFPDWEGTLALTNRTGRPVPVHVVFRRLHNPAREAVGAVLLLYDLRLPRHLDLTSREDLLTSLSNRRWVLELLEAEFQRVKRYGGPLAALWLEVVDLAGIEARFGAEASDEVLRRLGSILRGGLRRTDFCGRVGHRDFLAVLPETPADRAERVAFRLEKMFALSEEGETTGASLRVVWAMLDEECPSSEVFLSRLRPLVPTE